MAFERHTSWAFSATATAVPWSAPGTLISSSTLSSKPPASLTPMPTTAVTVERSASTSIERATSFSAPGSAGGVPAREQLLGVRRAGSLRAAETLRQGELEVEVAIGRGDTALGPPSAVAIAV